MREEHIQSAVVFLKEPQVAAAPMAKKIEFLESKGLTEKEINEALGRVEAGEDGAAGGGAAGGAAGAGVPSASSVPGLVRNYPPRPSYMTQQPPPIPERDWKDYFVMATVSVGVAYGLYECARRYVLPMIMPPTPAALEADKDALDAEFQRTEQLLKQLQEDTAELKLQEEVRTREFKRVMTEARDVIEAIKEQSDERKQESKLALSNVESLRDLLPTALKQHSETQAQAVVELQNELKSLKQLLKRRQPSSSPQIPPASSVPTTLPGYARKPKKPENTEPGPSTQPGPSAQPEPAQATATEHAQEPALGNANGTQEDAKQDAKQDDKQDDKQDKHDDKQDKQDGKPKGESFLPDPQAGIPAWQRAAG